MHLGILGFLACMSIFAASADDWPFFGSFEAPSPQSGVTVVEADNYTIVDESGLPGNGFFTTGSVEDLLRDGSLSIHQHFDDNNQQGLPVAVDGTVTPVNIPSGTAPPAVKKKKKKTTPPPAKSKKPKKPPPPPPKKPKKPPPPPPKKPPPAPRKPKSPPPPPPKKPKSPPPPPPRIKPPPPPPPPPPRRFPPPPPPPPVPRSPPPPVLRPPPPPPPPILRPPPPPPPPVPRSPSPPPPPLPRPPSPPPPPIPKFPPPPPQPTVQPCSLITFSSSAAPNSAVSGPFGPFAFPTWLNDVFAASDGSVYPRAIYNNLDTANFGVAPAGGVRLCGLALSSYTVAGTALISGTTAGGATPTPVTAAIPTYPKVTVVLLDDSWQKVTGAAISTVGLRGISLWGLYYYS